MCGIIRVNIKPRTSKITVNIIRLLVSRIHGNFKFRGIKLKVPKGCFAPVFLSTSLLVNVAVKKVRGRLGCDVGVGCGAVALSLIKERGVEMIGTDVDMKCIKASLYNAMINGIISYYHPVVCSEASCVRSCSVDFVVTNPPYLPIHPTGCADVSICGGKRLEIFCSMLSDALRVLRRGGVLVFTASNITGEIVGAKIVDKRKTPFDTIYAYIYKKKQGK